MKKLFRNYACDTMADKALLYKLMCEAFDTYQQDLNGVDYSIVFNFIMTHGKGRFNPMSVQLALDEFAISSYKVSQC